MIQIERIYTKKLNKVKVAIAAAIVLAMIAALISLCLVLLSENIEIVEDDIAQEIIEEPMPEPEEPKYIPVMTEAGINNINKIYSSDEKVAYLTFDDGPSADITPLILDLLKEEDIKATFFVLGSMVEKNPTILKRAYEEGHYIANHGYSHIYSKIYASTDTVLEEFNQTEEAIAKALEIENYATHLFRFPGGSVGGTYNSLKKKATSVLEEKNIAYLDWNALTRDSEGSFTKAELIQNLKSTVKEKMSVVILCHDASGKKSTYESLKDIIDFLREKEYKFGNMRDLIQ